MIPTAAAGGWLAAAAAAAARRRRRWGGAASVAAAAAAASASPLALRPPLLHDLAAFRSGGGTALAPFSSNKQQPRQQEPAVGAGATAPVDWELEDTTGLRLTRHALPPGTLEALAPGERRRLELATELVRRLTDAGCLALVAGGWVRDRLLGRPASGDVDVATSATNAQVKRLFAPPRYRVVDLPRNTARVELLPTTDGGGGSSGGGGGEAFEVATFRGAAAARRGSGLAAAARDAEARDFTVNALFYCPRTGAVLDFVGGAADVERRALRLCSGVLGDAGARLVEDPLRALRAVRLAVGLGLRIAPDTAQLLARHAHRCSVGEGVPARRILLELRKLAALDAAAAAQASDASAAPPSAAAAAPGGGAWVRCLALALHLGLLPHLFPWLKGGGAAQGAVVASARLAALASGGGSTGDDGDGLGADDDADAGGEGSPGGGAPLALRVAATVHPASSRAVYELVRGETEEREEREIGRVVVQRGRGRNGGQVEPSDAAKTNSAPNLTT